MTHLEAAALFNLPRCAAVVLARLDQSAGRIVDHGSLQTALEAVTGNGWTMESVRGPVKLVRRAIAGRGVVRSYRGMGYALTWL